MLRVPLNDHGVNVCVWTQVERATRLFADRCNTILLSGVTVDWLDNGDFILGRAWVLDGAVGGLYLGRCDAGVV